jgi:hypothetical protein
MGMKPIAITLEEGGEFYAPDAIRRYIDANGGKAPNTPRVFAVFFDDDSVFDPILGRMDHARPSTKHIHPELDENARRLLAYMIEPQNEACAKCGVKRGGNCTQDECIHPLPKEGDGINWSKLSWFPRNTHKS